MAIRRIDTVMTDIRNSAVVAKAIRRNPAYRRETDGAAASMDGHLAAGLLARIIGWAQQTGYGKGRSDRLEEWPILRRPEIALDTSRFRIPRRFDVFATTGGSSGEPLNLWRSLRAVAAENAFLDAAIAPAGINFLDSKLAILRGDAIKDSDDMAPPFGRFTAHGRKLILSSHHLSPATLPWYLDTLRKFKPDFIWAYPSGLIQFTRLVHEAGAECRVPCFVTSSEMISSDMRRQVKEIFGAGTVDYYGQAERACLASSSEIDSYRFHPHYGHVELVPEDGISTDAPYPARIIATGFWNRAMPLIRYDTGDFALIPAGTGADQLKLIAAGQLPFDGILGRDSEFLALPDGRRAIGLSHLQKNVPGLMQMQIVHGPGDFVTLRVLTTSEFNEASRAHLMENTRAKIPTSVRVEIELVKGFERTRSGKTPFIVLRP